MAKAIGDLNGKWSLLFRTGLALLPFLVAWGGYVSAELISIRREMMLAHAKADVWMARTDANRFTSQDWHRERVNLLNMLPPKHFVRRVERLEKHHE